MKKPRSDSIISVMTESTVDMEEDTQDMVIQDSGSDESPQNYSDSNMENSKDGQISTSEIADVLEQALDTHFERHLKDVYELPLGEASRIGLRFFETHGYYDTLDGVNSIQSFLDSQRMDSLWLIPEEDVNCWTSGGNVQEAKNDSKPRRSSVLAQGMIEEGMEIGLCGEEYEEMQIASELRRDEAQMRRVVHKVRSATQEAKKTIALLDVKPKEKSYSTVIPKHDETATQNTVPRPPGVVLPSLQSVLYILRKKRSIMKTKWMRRWFCLNFKESKLTYYRSILGRAQGDHVIPLSSVSKVTKKDEAEFELEYGKDEVMTLRTKDNQAASWVNIIEYAIARSMASKQEGSVVQAIDDDKMTRDFKNLKVSEHKLRKNARVGSHKKSTNRTVVA